MGTAVGGAWHGLPTLADGEIGRVLLPSVAGTMGRPRHRPDALLADRGSDHDKYRRLLSQRGIHPVIAARGQPTAAARASSGTSSRERSPGCTAPAACVSAGSDATTSTRRSSASSPASAPTDTSDASPLRDSSAKWTPTHWSRWEPSCEFAFRALRHTDAGVQLEAASRSSLPPAGSGTPTLALLCVHTRTSCPTRAGEVAPPWMLGSEGRRTPWKPLTAMRGP